MKTLYPYILLLLFLGLFTSCSQEEAPVLNETTNLKTTKKSDKSSWVDLESFTPICDKLGPRLSLHLYYNFNPGYFPTVYIDIYQTDEITLVDTWTIINYNEIDDLYPTIGHPGNGNKDCSILDLDTEYLIRIRYNTVETQFQPFTTSEDCFCCLYGCEG